MSNEEGKSAPTVEANVFCQSPGGYKTHFKLAFPEASGVLVGLRNLNTLIEALANAGYMPESGPTRTAAAKPGAAAAEEEVVCDACGGPVWDNRNNKRNPKGPDYTCKDKGSCGLVGWENANGEIKWQTPRI